MYLYFCFPKLNAKLIDTLHTVVIISLYITILYVCLYVSVCKSMNLFFSLFIDIIGGLHIIYISIFGNFVFLGNQITK